MSAAEPDAAAGPTWTVFEERLAIALADLDVDRTIILTLGETTGVPGGYVQFKEMEPGLFCEAVGDAYLTERHRFDRAAIESMRRLGWEEPSDAGNWWVGIEGEDRAELAARLAVRTLRNVYGATLPSCLGVDPVRLSVQLGAKPDLRLAAHRPIDTDNRIATWATEVGVYLGRNAAGVHTLGLIDTIVRLRIDDLGAVAVVQVAALVQESVPRRVADQETMGLMSEIAGSFSLDELVDATDGALENSELVYEDADTELDLWLSSMRIVPAGVTGEAEAFELCGAARSAARRARAVLSAD